jgi:hypothetical protein
MTAIQKMHQAHDREFHMLPEGKGEKADAHDRGTQGCAVKLAMFSR